MPFPSPPDLAAHFLECGKLDRFLTVFDDRRFVITDDFTGPRAVKPIAAAAAAVFSKDPLVGQAALVPLLRGAAVNPDLRDRLDGLFSVIEANALTALTRESATQASAGGFKAAELQAIEGELGATLTPARRRYRDFLQKVRLLADNKISAEAFRDEFLEFTYRVAGKLDFGIYSFLIDRIFGNDQIPLKVKGALALEVLRFPPLIRKELITNILAGAHQSPVLGALIRDALSHHLDPRAVSEISLLETLKISQFTINAARGFTASPFAGHGS